jgi:hypothetical protein
MTLTWIVIGGFVLMGILLSAAVGEIKEELGKVRESLDELVVRFEERFPTADDDDGPY